MKQMIFALALALTLGGCFGKAPQKVEDERVRYESNELRAWLGFDFVATVKREDGLVEFEARFINDSYQDKFLDYRVDWRDKNGFTQESVMSKWSTAKINGKREFIIHGISPNAKAQDFVVHLQRHSKN